MRNERHETDQSFRRDEIESDGKGSTIAEKMTRRWSRCFARALSNIVHRELTATGQQSQIGETSETQDLKLSIRLDRHATSNPTLLCRTIDERARVHPISTRLCLLLSEGGLPSSSSTAVSLLRLAETRS